MAPVILAQIALQPNHPRMMGAGVGGAGQPAGGGHLVGLDLIAAVQLGQEPMEVVLPDRALATIPTGCRHEWDESIDSNG